MMRNLQKKQAALSWIRQYRELKMRQAEQDACQRAALLSDARKEHDDARDRTDATRLLCMNQAAPGKSFDPLLMQLWYAELSRCEANEKAMQARLEEAEGAMGVARQCWQEALMATERATEDLAQISRSYARAKDQARLADAEELFGARLQRP